MRPEDALARRRWAAIQLARLAGYSGAVLGLIILARAVTPGPRVLGIAIVIAAFLMLAIVPPALARRWRTPK